MNRSNVLVTCAGRWVGLILHLKRAMLEVPQLQGGKVYVADADEAVPAACFAGRSFVVPKISDPGYVESLLDICITHDIRVLLPHIDIDLHRLAPHVKAFLEQGVVVISPSVELVDLCLDKGRFSSFAREEGLRHPRTYEPDQISDGMFPLFVKRRFGFGSNGAGVCRSMEQAQVALDHCPSVIFQEVIEGPELSVDAYVSVTGKCIARVQRVRDKVVGGEATRSHTVKWPATGDLADRTIRALVRRGIVGTLNIQMIGDENPVLTEVNPRPGSACLLSNIACRGRLFRAVLCEACGGVCEGDPDDYIEDLSLYRFHSEVYYLGSEATIIMPDLQQLTFGQEGRPETHEFGAADLLPQRGIWG